MSKIFRPSNKESKILSKIESQREWHRKKLIGSIRIHSAILSNSISMKLIENSIIETDNKQAIEEQIELALTDLRTKSNFDVDFKISPFRSLVKNPNIISLYITAFVIEDLVNHKDVVDIFGSDKEIYDCIHKEVERILKDII